MAHDIIKTLDDIYLTASYGSEEDPSSAPQALLRIGDLALKALREIDPTHAASESRTKAAPSEPTDSMGMPPCGKPLCSPGNHNPLCDWTPAAPSEHIGWICATTHRFAPLRQDDPHLGRPQGPSWFRAFANPDEMPLSLATHPAPSEPGIAGLTFDRFRIANVTRCLKWHPEGIESWSASDWMTALVGEVGELASLLKMLNRERDGLPGNKFSPTHEMLADEIADVQTYLDLLAAALDIDLGRATAEKFNKVSARVGFSDRIDFQATPPAPAVPGDVMEMCYCESRSVVLRLGQLYRFEACDGCATCAEMKAEHDAAYGAAPPPPQQGETR